MSNELREAAQAVIDWWDTPDDIHAAQVMQRLRKALEAPDEWGLQHSNTHPGLTNAEVKAQMRAAVGLDSQQEAKP